PPRRKTGLSADHAPSRSKYQPSREGGCFVYWPVQPRVTGQTWLLSPYFSFFGMNLSFLGWNSLWDAHFKKLAHPGWQPARVLRQDRGQYQVAGDSAQYSAFCSGRFLHQLTETSGYPAVGDWVAVEPS